MKTVLLHCCCAPCSSAIIEWMLNNDVKPIIFYSNPNIYPEQEYLIRKNEITKYAQKLGLQIIDDDYDHQTWLDYVKGLENELERGARCLKCFKLRLLRTARKCAELGISEFTTTLASSRWKSLLQINEAGQWAAEKVNAEIANAQPSTSDLPLSQKGCLPEQEPSTSNLTIHFDDRNWRKGGLQDRRNQLLKENNFYNQLYCGCEFSIRN